MRRFIARGFIRALLAAAAFHAGSPAQAPPPPLPPRDHIPAVLTFISPLIVPKVFQDCFLLREYVRSGEIASVRASYGDLYAVDCIFDRAMRLSWNNVYEALLVCAFGLMDHHRFGVRIPVLGAVFWFPLTSEFAGDFRARVDSLPSRLYADTPPEGDRDKLQHFFGSAFLTAITASREEADLFGLFVEWGEELFIVGGVNDARDVRANRQGQRFAVRILEDPGVLPSGFFTTEFPGDPGASPSRGADSTAPAQPHREVQ